MKKPIKRKNGKYTYDARPFLPVDNKRVIKIFTGNNAREKADAFAVEIEKQRDAKGLVSDKPKKRRRSTIVTMREILDVWQEYNRSNGKHSESYQKRIKTTIKSFDACPTEMIDLDTDHKKINNTVFLRVMEYRTKTAEKRVKRKTCVNDFRVLHAALSYCSVLPDRFSVKIEKNLNQFTKLTATTDSRSFYVPTPDEIQAVFDELLPSGKKIIYFLLATGCRSGQVCELKKSDVSGKYINFSSGVKLAQTNTSYEYTIEIPELPYIMVDDSESIHVFTNARGRKWRKDNLNNSLQSAIKKANAKRKQEDQIKKFCIHDLRHAYVVYQLVMGTNLRKIQENCNWRTLNMLNRYNNIKGRYSQYDHYLPAWSPEEQKQQAHVMLIRMITELVEQVEGSHDKLMRTIATASLDTAYENATLSENLADALDHTYQVLQLLKVNLATIQAGTGKNLPAGGTSKRTS